MKKSVFLILGICIAMMLSGCNKEKEPKEKYENLSLALDGYYEEIENAESSEQKDKILEELHSYVLRNFQGYYYFIEDSSVYGSKYARENDPTNYMHQNDFRAIYVKNMDEVYIAPFTKEYMDENNLKLEDLENLENSDLYKYKIVSFEVSGEPSYRKSVNIVVQSYYIEEKYGDSADEIYSRVEFSHTTQDESDEYNLYGYFADMVEGKEDVTTYMENLSSGTDKYRRYSRSLKNAASYCKAQAMRDQEKQLKAYNISWKYDSEPKVGMTQDDIMKYSWGYPTRIDETIDEYGYHEDWVYEKRRVTLHLENGILVSIE